DLCGELPGSGAPRRDRGGSAADRGPRARRRRGGGRARRVGAMTAPVAIRSAFPAGRRAAGLLLHVTSLPPPYGVGPVGPGARAWIDRLHAARQTWWQALPVGPTGYGNSPYQSLSSFAGNTLLISPEGLIEDELLRPSDCAGHAFSATTVEFNAVIAFK